VVAGAPGRMACAGIQRPGGDLSGSHWKHIFLDVITSFGTMVWSPLNYSRRLGSGFYRGSHVHFAGFDAAACLLAFRPLKSPWRRSIPLWAVFSAAAFAIGPLVRPLDVPFSMGASLFVAGAFSLFFVLPLRHSSGSHAGRVKWCRIEWPSRLRISASRPPCIIRFSSTSLNFAGEARLNNIENIAAIPLPPSQRDGPA